MAHLLRRLCGAAVLASALGIAFNVPLHAQSQSPSEPQTQPQTQTQTQTNVPDTKLESFVVAAISVQDLIEKWSPRIQNAQDEEEANTLRQQAQTEFVTAVENTEGISLEEYQTIGQQAQQDPQLNARIQEIYQTKVEE